MMDLSLSAMELIYAILSITGLLIGFICSVKLYSRHYGIQKMNKDQTDLDAKLKLKDSFVFNSTGTYFNVGLLFSISLCISFFSWTSYEKEIYFPEYIQWEDDMEQIPPQIFDRPPPPSPPKEIEEVIEEEMIEEEPEFIDESIDEKDFLTEKPTPVSEEKDTPKLDLPPPPVEQELDVPEIRDFAEQMPRFPGCESMNGSHKEKENCAKEKMLQYIYKNLHYPSVARENDIEGMVVVQFVVSKEGFIKDTKILRDIGAGCGNQASKVVIGMNDLPSRWTPGKQRGRKVDVRYTLPIRFKLQK